jgi:hypothetical protein
MAAAAGGSAVVPAGIPGGRGRGRVWNGDLPRPLQQMLFETADSLTAPAPPHPAEPVALTTA